MGIQGLVYAAYRRRLRRHLSLRRLLAREIDLLRALRAYAARRAAG